MNEKMAGQLVAELLEVNAQAFAIAFGVIGDVIGRTSTADALEQRLAIAKAAGGHPMALDMVQRAVTSLRAS
jgi:hypothetical protein